MHNFTAPQHGKFSHDAEGNQGKTALRNGLHKIRWEAREKKSHSETIREYLDTVWANKKSEISRKTFEIRDGSVEHKKSSFKSLPKFKQFFSFRTDPTNKNVAYYRELSCSCDHCITCDFDNCERVESCGVERMEISAGWK